MTNRIDTTLLCGKPATFFNAPLNFTKCGTGWAHPFASFVHCAALESGPRGARNSSIRILARTFIAVSRKEYRRFGLLTVSNRNLFYCLIFGLLQERAPVHVRRHSVTVEVCRNGGNGDSQRASASAKNSY